MTHHIAIIGSALSGNKGAAAMLESSVETLAKRVPDARFTLLSMYPEEDTRLNTYSNLDIVPATPARLGVTINSLALAYRLLPPLRPILRRSRAISALASADVLLDQGGITFTDGREKFLLYNIASILPALNMRLPVVKCAQAIGPFEGAVNRWASRLFLPKVALIITRGEITHEYADQLGLTNTVRGADYAFSLELDGTERETLSSHVDLAFFDTTTDVVGFSPSVVMQKKVDSAGGDYAQSFVDSMSATLEKGHRVLLVPHSTRVNTTKTHNNDLPLCRDIASRMGQREGFLFVDAELRSQELRYLISLTTRFVTSRFHAMISSLSMAVPTVVIGWSHKYKEVLDLFGLSDRAIGAADFSTERLLAELDRLEQDDTAVRSSINRSLPPVKALSLSQADHIAELVMRTT